MDIACLPEDIREGITTHQELDPANMLSLIASLTPFSDYNQSPRNMYALLCILWCTNFIRRYSLILHALLL